MALSLPHPHIFGATFLWFHIVYVQYSYELLRSSAVYYELVVRFSRARTYIAVSVGTVPAVACTGRYCRPIPTCYSHLTHFM